MASLCGLIGTDQVGQGETKLAVKHTVCGKRHVKEGSSFHTYNVVVHNLPECRRRVAKLA